MIKSYFRTTAQKPEEEAAVEQRGLAELRAETATALASSAGALPADNLLAVVTKDAAKRDTLLLRYLRSYSGDAAKASKAFKTMLLWRQRMKLEEVAEAMRYLGGPGIGLPLWVSPLRRKEEPRLGMTYCALAHVPKKFDYKMLERGCGVVFDWLLYVRDGVEAESLVSVVDFAGFSVSQADISAMKTSVVSYVHNYPGVFKKIYIVNYPVGIYALWKIVSPLLDQDTINAIVFVKSPLKLREELAGDMPDELMPDFLGGGGKTMEMQSNRMELANGVELSVAEVSQRLQ